MPSSSDEFVRQEFNKRNGIPKDTPLSSRPLSGYLVHKDAPMGFGSAPPEIEAQGDIEVILRKDTANRTSYTRGDPLKTGGRTVPLTSNDSDAIVDALVNSDGRKSGSNMADSLLGLLKSYTEKDFSGLTKSLTKDKSGKYKEGTEQIEAQILGGFDSDDIEGISYSYDRLVEDSANAEVSDVMLKIDIDSIMKNENLSEQDINELKNKYNKSIPITPSLKDLKIYRTSLNIKKKYESLGIGYVLFNRPDGKSIDDPRTYDKSANMIEGVEKTLINKIKREVSAVISKDIGKMKKPAKMAKEDK